MSINTEKVSRALQGHIPREVTEEEHKYILQCFLKRVHGGKTSRKGKAQKAEDVLSRMFNYIAMHSTFEKGIAVESPKTNLSLRAVYTHMMTNEQNETDFAPHMIQKNMFLGLFRDMLENMQSLDYLQSNPLEFNEVSLA